MATSGAATATSSAAATPSTPLFTKIAKDIWLSHGGATMLGVDGGSGDPDLVIMCGWMGAKLAHLHKYSAAYRALYPRTTILLIQSEPVFFFRPQRWNEHALIPAAEIIESFFTAGARPRILAHAFSNGGSSQLCALGALLRARKRAVPRSAAFASLPTSTSPTTPSALIIDSAPAQGTLRTAIRAFTGLIRNPAARLAISALVALLYTVQGYMLRPVFGVLPVGERLKADLRRRDVLPWMGGGPEGVGGEDGSGGHARALRLYIYSKTDELVGWREVAEHVALVRLERGAGAKAEHGAAADVRELVFEDSPHVAHARTDPARYWTAVKALWADV
ncbi:hypothetical protein HDZ31DRAFT_73219 [Schizophyllum fasciatum]